MAIKKKKTIKKAEARRGEERTINSGFLDSCVSIPDTRKAIYGIGNGFLWGKSEEGFEYWSKVDRNLRRIVNEAEVERARIKQEKRRYARK